MIWLLLVNWCCFLGSPHLTQLIQNLDNWFLNFHKFIIFIGSASFVHVAWIILLWPKAASDTFSLLKAHIVDFDIKTNISAYFDIWMDLIEGFPIWIGI